MSRQGHDVGEQYRSIILATCERQLEEAENFIKELDASHTYEKPIVTEVKPFEQFFPAEEYHQKYYERNPEQTYCQIVINPKLQKLREQHAAFLKDSPRL